MDDIEIEKSIVKKITDIIEYDDNSVAIKTILKKSTGRIIAMSFDRGEGLAEKTSAFDTFVQIIEGKAEVIVGGELNKLKSGELIIVPAHRSMCIKSNGRFKLILINIKSGYE
jgi:quercetin dioxygenase-like cupin family protein